MIVGVGVALLSALVLPEMNAAAVQTFGVENKAALINKVTGTPELNPYIIL